GSLPERGDPQLAIEQRDELAVLADGAGPVAGAGKQLDERALTELVQRIQRHPATRRLDRAACIAGGEPGGGEPSEEIAHGALDTRGARRLPVVERRAVAQGKAGQERASSEPRRCLQVGPSR